MCLQLCKAPSADGLELQCALNRTLPSAERGIDIYVCCKIKSVSSIIAKYLEIATDRIISVRLSLAKIIS